MIGTKQTKKVISWLLTLAMLLSLIPSFTIGVSAANEPAISVYNQMLAHITPENNYGLGDISESRIFHAWGWSYQNIRGKLEDIAKQGFSTILVSPPNEIKMPTKGVKFQESAIDGISPNGWWMLYQPAAFQLNESSDNALGTKDDFVELCETAHRLGLDIMIEAVVGYMGTDDDYVGEYDNVSEDPMNHVNPRAWEFEPEILYAGAFHSPWVNSEFKSHEGGFSDYDIEESLTQHAVDGKPDLATEDRVVQDAIYDYFIELVEAGADSFYFNDAKYIETSSDTFFPSDFWNNTLVRIRDNYPDKKLYAIAEMIDGPGDGRSTAGYLQIGMNLTNTAMSDVIRNSVTNGTDITAAFDEAFPQENSVLWGESYKSYANGETSALTPEQRSKIWALTVGRKGVTGIYLGRPSDELAVNKDEINNILSTVTLGEAKVTDWSTDVVKRINHFAGFFENADENVHYDNGITVIERGGVGAVLVNMQGNNAQVSLNESTLVNGNYTDSITGNKFTVKNGEIKGEIGESGIAVLYLSDVVLLYNIWVGGQRLTSNNRVVYNTDENDNITGSATYDFSTNTLTLKDFTYSSDGDINAAIRYTGSDDLKLVLNGASSITCTNGSGFGVDALGNIEISGSGSMNVIGGSYGVSAMGSITIKSGEIVAQGGSAAFSKAPVIDSDFTNAVVWYGESESAANAAGAKDKADLADNYNQKYVKVECNHGGENATYENGFCVCGYYEPAVLKDDNVYEISNGGQLFWFAELVNNSTDGPFNAVLTKDIDLEEREWTPIGYDDYPYSGHFNGKGHTVSGLLVATEASLDKDAGLFGHIKGAGIRNLSVDGRVEYATSVNNIGVGLMVGYMTDSIVYNCYTSGRISETSSSTGATGGLVGIAQHSVIINCGSEADVMSSYSYLGGLVGHMTAGYDEPMCLLNSYSTGNVVGGSEYTGGLVGYLKDDAVNNYFFGTVSGEGSSTGVLFGEVSNSITIDGNSTTFEPVIEKNYYTSGDPIGNITDGMDATGYTQQYTSSDELLRELNSNLGIIEDIIAGHRGYLKESQWAELVELLDGDSVTVLHWRMVDDKVVHCSGTNEDADYICDICGKYLPTAFVVAEYDAETSTATVLIPTAGTYTLIFADYEGTELNNVDIVTVTTESNNTVTTVTSEIDITLDKGDKIMLWQDMTNFVPICDAYIVK